MTRSPIRLSARLLLAAFALITGSAQALDARVAIERAVRQIELGDFALARSHLEIPLIDGRITPSERSRAYYLQGYSLQQQHFYVSAGQNYAKALAFNPSNPATLAALGQLYQHGQGVTQSVERATELLRRSAELGHGPGMTAYGALLLANLAESTEPHGDLQRARDWLTRATEATSPTFETPGQDVGTAFLFLAQSYRIASTIDPDPVQALAHYEQALLHNEPKAFNSIGQMYLTGELGERDVNAAIAAFTRGAASGDSASQVSLGYLYLMGTGLPADRNKAQTLFTQAAADNDVRAHHYLGYLNETAAPPAPDVALNHYQTAARSDHLPAIARLAELAFANDQPLLGIEYLRQAARTGNAAANNQLGWLLATSSDAAIRDGTAAVNYARTALASRRSAATLDTLAAAYAEANQFEDAIRTQKQALELLGRGPATTTKAQEIADFRARLVVYQQHKPWRTGTPIAQNDKPRTTNEAGSAN